MFGFLKNNRQVTGATQVSQVGCLGKLPIYDEFIRHNVIASCVLNVDEWIQQGFSHYTRGQQALKDKAALYSYTYNFAFTGSGDQSSTVIGTMIGSHDKCGRKYPFLLFKNLSNQNTRSLTSTLPCAYDNFFNGALKLCSTDWSLQPINMLKKRVDALYPGSGELSRRHLMESEIAAFKTVTRNQFWQEILDESAEIEAPLYIEVMRDLLETVFRKSPLRTAWGVEVPLPANDRTHVHVSFWVRVAETILGGRGWRPHYIWGDIRDREKQSLFLFFRPITPIFFSYLLGDRTENSVLINLEKECKCLQQTCQTARRIGDTTISDDLVCVVDEWANWDKR